MAHLTSSSTPSTSPKPKPRPKSKLATQPEFATGRMDRVIKPTKPIPILVLERSRENGDYVLYTLPTVSRHKTKGDYIRAFCPTLWEEKTGLTLKRGQRLRIRIRFELVK